MAKANNKVNHINSSRPQDNSARMNVSTRDITVDVSGSRFCIVPSLFKHIENLNWKKHKPVSRSKKILKLNADPDMFESVLRFFLHAKLPDSKNLSNSRAKTLIDFISPLDPVVVKSLVDYLQPFVVERTPTTKTSFMKRSLTNLSSPFSSHGSRNKCKPSNRASTGHPADQGPSRMSSNNHKPPNSDNIRYDRACLAMNVPSAVVSSIPTHIEHPVTTSTTIAEISVCSMDESSSISKLSLQSSSWGMTLPAGHQNENSTPASTSTYTNHQLHHLQNQDQHQYQRKALQLEERNTVMNKQSCTQDSSFSIDNYFEIESLSAALVGHDSDTAAKSELSKRISNKRYRQYIPQRVVEVNDYIPFTQTHNFLNGVKFDNRKRNRYDSPKKSSINQKLRATTNSVGTVLGGGSSANTNNKKNCGIGTNTDGKSTLLRKQKQMTHADWCASEYVV